MRRLWLFGSHAIQLKKRFSRLSPIFSVHESTYILFTKKNVWGSKNQKAIKDLNSVIQNPMSFPKICARLFCGFSIDLSRLIYELQSLQCFKYIYIDPNVTNGLVHLYLPQVSGVVRLAFN